MSVSPKSKCCCRANRLCSACFLAECVLYYTYDILLLFSHEGDTMKPLKIFGKESQARTGTAVLEPGTLDTSNATDVSTAVPADKDSTTLVRRAQNGDEAAFASIVELYERFVYNTAVRVLRMSGGNPDDGEDVAQNVFLKAWRSLDSFRGDCAVSTWLYRITVNAARDQVRVSMRHETDSLTASDPDSDDETSAIDVPVTSGDTVPESAIDRRETILAVRRAIESLPPDMRKIIVLRDLNDMSYQDIAVLLHVEVGTVKSRLNRARNSLKKILKDGNIFDS